MKATTNRLQGFDNNPFFLSKDGYDEFVKENIGGVYPQIDISGSYQHYFRDARLPSNKDNVINGSINLNQILWAGGKVGSAIKMAKLYSKSGKEELKTAQKDTVKRVKQKYYAVLLAKKKVDEEEIDRILKSEAMRKHTPLFSVIFSFAGAYVFTKNSRRS